MMICDADFDELFPWTTPIKRPTPRAEKAPRPSAIRPFASNADEAGLDRWKDDGGRTRIRRKNCFLDGGGIVTIDRRHPKGYEA